jgi:signal transduction histidine kinase
MSRSLVIHLIALAVLIATTAYVLREIGPAMPAVSRNLVIGLTAGYAMVWAGLLMFAGAARDGAGGPTPAGRLIMWLGNIVCAVSFWLEMPYADDALRLLVVIFFFGPVSVEVLGTIRRPPAQTGRVLEPLFLPACTGLWFIVHWGRFSLPLLLFTAVYLFVIMTLRRIVQSAVDRAYAARQAAEAARESKSRFLASASHDLTQPLQAARLSFDQAMRNPDPAQRERAQRRAEWAFDSIDQLLRQMIDHLRLESGQVEPRIERFAIGPLISRIAEMNEPAARLAGVSLHAVPSRLEAVADPALVERCVGNLVANAIRHAKARRIVIGARRQGGGRVRLWVIDDGLGIPEADRPRLFDDYVRGSDHLGETRGGFGLGLASARRMAALMRGSVSLEPNWLNGSAFWLELDIAKALAR